MMNSTKDLKEKRKKLAQTIYDYIFLPEHPISCGTDCVYCIDAMERNNGEREGMCKECLYPPFMCRNGMRNGILSKFKKMNIMADIHDNPIFQLAVFFYETTITTGDCTLEEFVVKAEELGIGEHIAYWKVKLLEQKLETLQNQLDILAQVNQVAINKLCPEDDQNGKVESNTNEDEKND